MSRSLSRVYVTRYVGLALGSSRSRLVVSAFQPFGASGPRPLATGCPRRPPTTESGAALVLKGLGKLMAELRRFGA